MTTHAEYMRAYRADPTRAEKHRESSRRWREANRDLHRAYQRGYHKDHPDQARNWIKANLLKHKNIRLRAYEDMTLERYEEILDAQGGGCYFCGRSETATRNNAPIRYLSVDHDHRSGRIRGLLCIGCNISLGHYERGHQSRLSLDKAEAYLREESWW
jgi:hypothetical protein